MALSPLDIKNKSFPVKMRGYNSDEVDDFLDQVITDYEDSIIARRELEKALKHAEEKLAYFNELKDALNQSIIVAQDTADKLKDSASREAELVVTTANADAKAIVDKATAEADVKVGDATRKAQEIMGHATETASHLASETDELKKNTREFHRSLSLLLESQLEIVKSKSWKDLLLTNYHNDEAEVEVEAELDLEDEYEDFEDLASSTNTESEGKTEAIDLDELLGKKTSESTVAVTTEVEFDEDDEEDEVEAEEETVEPTVEPTVEIEPFERKRKKRI